MFIYFYSLLMAIKEELEKEVKEEGGGQDELDALDALEKEAKEYNKVHPCLRLLYLFIVDTFSKQDAEIDRIIQAFKLDA